MSEPAELHRLLLRQARRAGIDPQHVTPDVALLLQRVSATYRDADDYRALMTRANELSSQELTALNARIRETNEGLEEEVRRRTQELLQAKEAADASLRVKSEFLANMSHELRTPLHGMLGFAEIGEQRATAAAQDKFAHYFRRIGESGNVLLALLDNLLDLAKLEAGRMQMHREPTCLRLCCRRVLDEFAATVRSRAVTLELVGGDDAAAEVDPMRFMQIVRNLVSNAIKFAPAGSRVTIDVARVGTVLEVRCRDRGPGIPEGELGSIFEAFTQSSATKTGAGGTGLGLSICREIAIAHDGEIFARNAADGGAEFVLRLPARAPRARTAP